MTEITRTFDPADEKLVPFKLPYRSRLSLAMSLGLDDQADKEKLEKAWDGAVRASFDEVGTPPDPNRMPNADEAYRFIKSNPAVAASFLIEVWRVAREDDRCSDGRLRELWKQAGGVVKDQKAWIEVHLLPGLLRLLSEIPPSQSTPL